MNWVLDADIRNFYDSLSHEWTMKFIEHRVADRRMLRLIQKWLKAGVSEDGQWSETNVGTPQGSVVSPLLANAYLHYGAPGQTWCFQRVKFPPRQEVQPPHRGSSGSPVRGICTPGSAWGDERKKPCLLGEAWARKRLRPQGSARATATKPRPYQPAR